ncbi:hypothetical protein EV702DRAFT_1159685 [Suillus placidus]|uniref:Uncharacterized protein n=1 Tax=Suillus placidus TaxID=48579 RepID=A0A9P7CV93_9AGAM|nr:hypothetical protein EV702DRAFT_1161106 [Suillus placidus]KAG1762991.1 hypothetical protein EV702DRAFT_1159685 [Suillus placidus]
MGDHHCARSRRCYPFVTMPSISSHSLMAGVLVFSRSSLVSRPLFFNMQGNDMFFLCITVLLIWGSNCKNFYL